VTRLMTQEDFERVGLLPLRDALTRTGWEWTIDVHERTIYVRLEARLNPRPFFFGHFVTAVEGGQFERLFCSAHDGGTRAAGLGSSCCEYMFLQYAT